MSNFSALLSRIRKLKSLSILPGHFYSPVVMPEELYGRENAVFESENIELYGININEAEQLKLLNIIKTYYPDIHFPFNQTSNYRYYFNNDYFSYNSAIELFGIIRHFKPKKIVEVGSGFSSALMIDTNEFFMDNKIELTFIEPFPTRLNSLLRGEDKVKHLIIEKIVQDVDIKYFLSLDENDILFIDSSHVSKTGSDLNHLLFKILPKLRKGVIIHFHDIFYPFEYPKDWVMQKGGFGWNENYILRAFLTNNSHYKILLFNTYMEKKYQSWFIENMPDCLIRQGGSIFLQKTL